MKKMQTHFHALFFYILLFCGLISTSSVQAQTTVTNTSNTGAGSLRQAITDVVTGGTITFNLPTSATSHTIQLATELFIGNTKSFTIDASTTTSTVIISTSANTRILRIDATGQTITLRNLTIQGGNTLGAVEIGAGIYVQNGTVIVTNCTISNNRANNGNGGGIYVTAGNVTIHSSTIVGNYTGGSSGGVGGGLYTRSASVVNVINCTFTQNMAAGNNGSGGAIYHRYTQFSNSLTIMSSTITGNTAEGNIGNNWTVPGFFGTVVGGGGIGAGGNATIHITSTIVAGNTGGQRPDIAYGEPPVLRKIRSSNQGQLQNGGDAITSGGHNLIGSVGEIIWTYNTTGDRYGDPLSTTVQNLGAMESPTAINALLGTLANNGGPTQTMLPLTGSPVINNGSATAPSTDQRGFTRVGTADIGAAEFIPVAIISSVTPSTTVATVQAFPITITGTGFTGTTILTISALNNLGVTVGTVNLLGFITSSSATTITVTLPAGVASTVGTLTINLTAAAGATSALFTVTPIPPPAIASITPNPVSSTTAAVNITLSGTWMQNATTLTIGRLNAEGVQIGVVNMLPFTFGTMSATSISIALPAGTLATGGTLTISLSNAQGTTSADLLVQSSTIIVTNANNDGGGSLRRAFQLTSTGGTIQIQGNIPPIQLNGGPIPVNKDVRLIGSEQGLEINGNGAPIFDIQCGGNLYLENINLTGSGNEPAVQNTCGNIIMRRSRATGN